jgi:hypothetical protein
MRRGPITVNTALHNMEKRGARLTVGIAGSFGILHYAILAFPARRSTTSDLADVERWPLAAEDLLGRGFRPARDADVEAIVLKAQPAKDSIQCRASTEGLISLLVDNDLVWSRQFNPEDPETARWLRAALTTGVTVISGDRLLINGTPLDHAPSTEPLLMAKIATVWNR